MTGPATPGQEGPSFAPPPLPEGWIAQWDGVGRKYYFVQRSTGASQWELPTHPAPTVGTPTATPGQEISPFPRPGQNQEIGQRGVEENQARPDGERGLGSMAMNQLLHAGGGRHSNQQSNPLVNLAGSLLGTGSHNQSGHSSGTGAGGLVSTLAGSLLGGGKPTPNQPQLPQQHSSYSGPQHHGGYEQQQGQGGLIGKMGGLFGGSPASQQNNQYGYSQSGSQQGGYTGQPPPASYQPAPPSSSSYGQQSQQSQHGTGASLGASSYYNSQPSSYGGGAPQQQVPAYGSSVQHPPYSTPQQPPFNAPSYPQQPPYGASHQQPTYGALPQHQQQQYPPPTNYSGGPPQQQPPYGSGAYGGMPTGNLAQPQHHNFQGVHNTPHQGGLYGNGDQQVQLPIGSHPTHSGLPGGYGGSGPGGYSEMQGSGRW